MMRLEFKEEFILTSFIISDNKFSTDGSLSILKLQICLVFIQKLTQVMVMDFIVYAILYKDTY